MTMSPPHERAREIVAMTVGAIPVAAALAGCSMAQSPGAPASEDTSASASAAASPSTPTAAPEPRLISDLSGFCQRLGPALPEAARSLPLDDQHSSPVYQSCEWGRAQDPFNSPVPPLTVVAKAHLQYDADGNPDLNAVTEALDKANEARNITDPGAANADPQPVPGLGEWAVAYEFEGRTNVKVVTRNVTMAVEWNIPGSSPAAARDDAVAVARAAVAQLPS